MDEALPKVRHGSSQKTSRGYPVVFVWLGLGGLNAKGLSCHIFLSEL